MAASAPISFPTGVVARTARANASESATDLVAELELPMPPRGTIVVSGSTAPLGRDVRERMAEVVVDGLATYAMAEGLTVLTGGTDAGVFSLLGPALAGHRAPIVGVVPEGRVSWPGMRSRADFFEREPLEPHHTHFVLVEGDEWGDETPLLLTIADVLSQQAPSVAVLCGGGAGAQLEAIGHVRTGRRLVVIAGSGRLADDIALAVAHGGAVTDPELAEIAASPTVTVFPRDESAQALQALLRRALS